MRKGKYLIRVIAMLAVLVLLVSACGKDQSDDTKKSNSSTGATEENGNSRDEEDVKETKKPEDMTMEEKNEENEKARQAERDRISAVGDRLEDSRKFGNKTPQSVFGEVLSEETLSDDPAYDYVLLNKYIVPADIAIEVLESDNRYLPRNSKIIIYADLYYSDSIQFSSILYFCEYYRNINNWMYNVSLGEGRKMSEVISEIDMSESVEFYVIEDDIATSKYICTFTDKKTGNIVSYMYEDGRFSDWNDYSGEPKTIPEEPVMYEILTPSDLLEGIGYEKYKDPYEVLLETYPDDLYCDKPVIYLYPEEEQEVCVDIDLNGELTYTYPEYKDGWVVTAYPDGTIINKEDGRQYSYLFWEGKSDIEYDMSEGFVVRGEDTAEFLQATLEKMGLTPKEYNEFIVYWAPQMENNPYNLIKFAADEYTDNAVLNISPQPDSMLRVFMVYKPLEQPVSVREQEITTFIRKGFCVVEWGGCSLG